MKKRFNFLITLIFLFMLSITTNVNADDACNISDKKAEGKRIFELRKGIVEDNQDTGCMVIIKVESDGSAQVTYQPMDRNPQKLGKNESSFTCNDIKVKLNISMADGLDSDSLFKNSKCKYTSSGTYEIYGLTKYTGGSGEIECAEQEFKINENDVNEKICKVQFSSDKDGNITFKYGSKTLTSPDIKSGKLSCEVGGDSTFIYLPNRSYDKGSIKSYNDCPKVTSDSPEDSNITAEPDNNTSKDYDHGLGDLISEWFSKDNDDNMNADEIDCNQVIQGKLGEYLTKIFSIMKYLGIVLCVGMTIYDFVKALLDSDKEIMNKLVKKAFTRLILVAVLFFLPTFINLIIKLFVENPCEIKF